MIVYVNLSDGEANRRKMLRCAMDHDDLSSCFTT
jgi:hypothetical protein